MKLLLVLNSQKMKKLVLSILTVFLALSLNAQKFMTSAGYVYFFSETPVENIKADNFSVSSILDTPTGELVFKVPIKSFDFEKKLMQEHFNENYLESDKFPDASFKGKIVNLSEVNFEKEGRYKAVVQGQLTIHGVTKDVKSDGQIDVAGGKIYAKSTFFVAPEDYNIEIPNLVKNKIAKSILISVDMKYDKMD